MSAPSPGLAREPVVVERLGNVAPDKPVQARNIWDMVAHQGRIYLAHGDYHENSGPTAIRAFDAALNRLVTEFVADDEAIHRYRAFGEELWVAGVDATESWDFGNIYRRRAGSWEKLRTIPDASHVWDVFLHDGALFVSVSSPGRGGCRNLVSADGGRSWRPVPIEAPEGFPAEAWSGIPVMPIEPFFAWKGRLCGGTMGQLNGRALAVCLNDERSAFLSMAADAFPGLLSPQRSLRWHRLAQLGPTLVYLAQSGVRGGDGEPLDWRPAGLFYTTALARGTRVPLPEEARPFDLLVVGDRLLVLTSQPASRDGLAQLVRVLASRDLTRWDEVCRFTERTFARSFAVLNDDLYFGLGASRGSAADAPSGDLLRIRGLAARLPD